MIYIAHRGASAVEPENTLRSIRAALDLGCDAIEVDVRHVEGRLVIIHDATLDRTTNGRGQLTKYSFDELRQFDAGRGERIPTLEEVVDAVQGRVPLILELKAQATGTLVAEYVSKRVKAGMNEYAQFLLSSFDQYELLDAMKVDPFVPRAILVQGTPLGLAKFAEPLRPHSIHLSHEFIRAEFVSDAKQRGYLVYVYTVDDIVEAQDLGRLGIDAVFTNAILGRGST